MSARQVTSRLIARAGSSRQPFGAVLSRAASSSSASSPSSSSSSSSSSTWQPVLPPGTSPAYDVALSYLSSYQSTTLNKLKKLQSKFDPSNPDPALLQRIDKMEVEAYANDPAVRRVFKETGGKGEMGKAIYRWLGEQQWKKEGGIDLLMQRLLQMNIVPDLLPTIPPTAPLTLTLNSSSIEPGSFQPPSSFSSPPTLKSQIFHHPSLPSSSSPNPEALHTLLVIDPDAPSHETHSFDQRVHYLKTDIPLSVLSGDLDLFGNGLGKELLSWEPPAPEQGTPKHRYVFLLFRQISTSTSTDVSRDTFDLRSYLSQQDLVAEDLVGINMVRAKWSLEENDFINSVYTNQRGIKEGAPVYGKVPKEVRYGYPMSAKRQRIEEAREEAYGRAVAELEGLAEDVEGLSLSHGEEEKHKV
ncbi:uncharacterized protein IL334_006983 [Kwoniella shivajii]|uniref:PEBP-like protein n=1 Tax=Kwoniella shivajii TaxID=564305 RepID=A0ABZ1D7W5_9TREE|nr:hypothetical protein IL334_006983 [Kwoniella shivajii]